MISFTEPISKATAPRLPPLSRLERAIQKALLDALDKIQASTKVTAIRDALDEGDLAGAVEAVRIDLGESFLRSAIPSLLREAYELDAHDVAQDVGYSFDILSPSAVDWVRANAGSLIEQWGASSRQAIANLVSAGFEANTPAMQLARQIRDSGIGLTWRQAKALQTMRDSMEAANANPKTIDKRIATYYKQLVRYRSELIARTENARASIHARQEAWRQGIAEGRIDPSRTVQRWIATPGDPRCCEECIDLNGTVAELGGRFISESGVDGGEGPPQHPNCRCSLTLTDRK